MLFKPPAKAFAPFYDTPVAFHGALPGSRELRTSVLCMVVEDTPAQLTDAIAPTLERSFVVTFPAGEWYEATPPQIGEWLGFVWSGKQTWAKVETVGHLPGGEYALTATWSPDRKGGAPWLT